MSDELSNEFPPELRPPACTHSVLDPACASCWYGAARRVAKERNDLMNLRLLKVLENELLAEAHEESARLAAHNGLLIEERDAAITKQQNAEHRRDEMHLAWNETTKIIEVRLVRAERTLEKCQDALNDIQDLVTEALRGDET